MYLKALTMKGFKSFADTTHLELEPGVTVVVGPNGSGKSNVVDAIAWVLGAQAPSIVRSQKMDDVIFAGAARRAALGRAEVTLTIDNSDGVLPIEFSEVTVTRVLFRSGDSEYSINGAPCRLLDIQELMSDTGVGRQQHIIVSQGQIDAVLNSRPEERRAIIEEAAGVLKYRKRKERSERRLAATEDNLQRLSDMAREVRRQLKPLARQAEAAARHETLAQEVTDLKTFLVGRELSGLRVAAEELHKRGAAARQAEAETHVNLGRLDAEILDGEAELAALGGSEVGDVLSTARSIRERIRGQVAVLAERHRRLTGELQNAVDDDVVASLEAEAAELVGDLAATDTIAAELEPAYERLLASEADHRQRELELAELWGDGPGAAPTRAAELRAEMKAGAEARDRDARQAEKLARQAEDLANRSRKLTVRRDEVAGRLAEAEQALPAAEAAVVAAAAERQSADDEVVAARDAEREAMAEASRTRARAEALQQALDDARAAAGADALAGATGVLGTLLDLVSVDEGYEVAAEAAIGESLRAVVVDGVDAARAAVDALAKSDLSAAVLALGSITGSTGPGTTVGRSVRDKVSALRPDVDPLLDVLLGRTVVVDGDWSEALDAALSNPELTVVTTNGDRFGPSGWRLGSGGSGATGAALVEAVDAAEAAHVAADTAASALAAATKVRDAQRERLRVATSERDGLVAAQRSAAAEMESIVPQLDTVAADIEALGAARDELDERLTGGHGGFSALENELAEAEVAEAEHRRQQAAFEADRSQLTDQARALASLRKDLEVRAAGAAERRELLQARQATVEQRLSRLVQEREEAQVRRVEIEAAIATVDQLSEELTVHAGNVESWIGLLKAEHDAQSAATQKVSAALSSARRQRAEAEKALAEATARLAKVDLDLTENRVRVETLTEKLRTELAVEPDVAMATDRPEVPEGASPQSHLRELERELKRLGPVNPLAVEEHAQVAERDKFLTDQLADVRSSRTELQKLIRSIDGEIVSVFSSAFADVAENFTSLFEVLFPGGAGRVRLVGEDDLLNCGVEIDAKPSGKNVKKLSLLSGGERSLVALAFLFAVFRSRPSPFYVMDEVEAALDDMNLTRFLALIGEFRTEAQLVIVSHQKRTMEAADVLYGVSMKPGGSSKAVSEKAAAATART